MIFFKKSNGRIKVNKEGDEIDFPIKLVKNNIKYPRRPIKVDILENLNTNPENKIPKPYIDKITI